MSPLRPQKEDYPENFNRPPKSPRDNRNPGNTYPGSKNVWVNHKGVDYNGASSGPGNNDSCLIAIITLFGVGAAGLAGAHATYQQLSASSQERIVKISPPETQKAEPIQGNPNRRLTDAANHQIDLIVPPELLRTNDGSVRVR